MLREGYSQPTPIQAKAIPHVLAGSDMLGCAQTGTGKTAAFALPIIQKLSADLDHGAPWRPIRALVITPTRELAAQIAQSFITYGRFARLRNAVVYGGVRQRRQTAALKKGPDILVATPGRLLDLMGQGLIKLDKVEVFVLDEADRMLDMGFIQDIRKVIAKLPKRRQTLMFSATMPEKIRRLADAILSDPIEVRVSPETPAAETVDHSVYFVERRDKLALLQHLLEDPSIKRALIFTRTKRAADGVAWHLKRAKVSADAIHADRPQVARQKALERFKRGATRALVASDIASRGLDVDDVSHVINFDMPEEAEVYVHRIGRTGRAGAAGKALSLCDIEERGHLDQIERLIRMPLKTVEDHPFPSPLPRGASKAGPPPAKRKVGPLRRGVRPGIRRR